MDRQIVPQLFLAGVMLLAAISINGCSSTGSPKPTGTNTDGTLGKVMQAIGLDKSPSTPTTNVTVQQVPMQIFTGSNLNAGNRKKPLALVVKFFQLRSPDRFEHLSFDDFVDDDTAQNKLGTELINSREMLVLPRQHYASIESTPSEVQYLGIVALFRAPAAQRWRFIYDVKKSTITGITLGLHACAMSSTSGKLITDLPESAASLVGVHCATSGS